MTNYYANINGNNEGPFTLDQLKELARAGRIVPTTYVIAEGAQDWMPASGIPDLFAAAPELPPLSAGNPNTQREWTAEDTARMARQGAQAAKQGAQKAIAYGETITSKSTGFWGAIIMFIKRVLNQGTVRTIIAGLSRTGIYAMVLAALGILGAAVLVALKFSQYGLLGLAVLVVGTLSLVQYFATRFMDSAEQVISATPTRIGSDALPEALALVVFLGSVGSAVAGISFANEMETLWPLMVGVAVCLSGMLVAGISLNTSLLNISVGGKISAGEEAIGLISFVAKSWLRAVPAIFGVVTLLGALQIVWSVFKQLGGHEIQAEALITSGLIMVFVGGLLPVLGLLLFLWNYLFVDVLNAILVLPSKLDRSGK